MPDLLKLFLGGLIIAAVVILICLALCPRDPRDDDE